MESTAGRREAEGQSGWPSDGRRRKETYLNIYNTREGGNCIEKEVPMGLASGSV